jgi:hypothetical protein
MTDYKLQDLQQDVERLANRLKNGCRNHGCVIKEPTGMATNGGCKCTPRQVMDEMLNLTCAIERMNNRGASWNK